MESARIAVAEHRGKWCLIALIVAFSTVAQAQVLTGEIDGTVRDTTGAVIVKAVVTVTNSDQNLVLRTLKTDSKGQFSAPLHSGNLKANRCAEVVATPSSGRPIKVMMDTAVAAE